MDSKEEKFLNIFLYHLIDETKLPLNFEADFLSNLQKDYSPDERDSVLEAMNWASKQPDLNLRSKLPGIRFSNEEIQKVMGAILTQAKFKDQ